MPERGYAVIDLKTTGLFPYKRDRVVEVAVVHLDEGGHITARWDTVVNPERNLGRREIHSISTAELLRAPTFEQIAPQLVELVNGRVLVAHNAQFDTGFLMSEFELIGYAPRRGIEAVCTMQLARDFLPGSGRLLADCCAAYDIEVDAGESALAQAVACAGLLQAYLSSAADAAPWVDALNRAAASPWPVYEAPAFTGQVVQRHVDTWPRSEWIQRDPITPGEQRQTATFLQRVAMKLPDYTGPEQHLDYLALLDLCLLDHELSANETAALMQLAELSGIGRGTCAELHKQYFEDVARVAWAGGVSPADRADLIAVAGLLKISPSVLQAALTPPQVMPRTAVIPAERLLLEPGDIVVLTGEMARARSDWGRELAARGLAVSDALTLRTRLLVAADPGSLTGKTVKARDYGIPIVSEFGLRSLIGVR